MNLSIISNVLVEHHIRNLSNHNDIKNIFKNINYISFESVYEEKNKLSASDVIAVIINFDALCLETEKNLILQNIDRIENDIYNRCNRIYTYIKTNYNVKVVWFGFEDYSFGYECLFGNIYVYNGLVDRINLKLGSIIQNTDVLIDMKRLIAQIGVDVSIDKKGYYRWNAPYSATLVSKLLGEIVKQAMIFKRKTPKCIIVDCDNVLWGGILSEVGIEGIKLNSSGIGRVYQDFQRFLLQMFYSGIIICICSKNDEADVKQVFNEHDAMLLNEENIAYFKCNWLDKPNNIRDIICALNIDADSVVFVDDSDFEVEAVRTLLPKVKTIKFNRYEFYRQLNCFNLSSTVDLENIRKRTNTYKWDAVRAKLKSESSSFDEYLLLLDMKIDIHMSTESEMLRISELTQRTNKCTNGRRYTLEQITEKCWTENYWLFTVCLKDKYSDLGVVGVIGLYHNEIDLFALSCRALGRNIENKMIDFINNQDGITEAYFDSTSKNLALKQSLINNGYVLKCESQEYGDG